MRSRELGERTLDERRIWPLRMRVKRSPIGSMIMIAPYQLALVMPGIWPKLDSERSAIRDIFTLR